MPQRSDDEWVSWFDVRDTKDPWRHLSCEECWDAPASKGVCHGCGRTLKQTIPCSKAEDARAIRAELIAEFKEWLEYLTDHDNGCCSESDYPPGEVLRLIDERFKP